MVALWFDFTARHMADYPALIPVLRVPSGLAVMLEDTPEVQVWLQDGEIRVQATARLVESANGDGVTIKHVSICPHWATLEEKVL